MRVWSFGDSWADGWGLDKSEKCLGQFVADHYECEHFKKGQSSNSLGQILYDFQNHSKQFFSQDLIIVIVPPDIRWYTEIKGRMASLHQPMKAWKKFIKGKSDLWFKYHHSLFIYTFYCISRDYNCNLIMAHNYGKLCITSEFDRLIPKNVFLNREKSLTALLQHKEWSHNYDMIHDGPSNPLEGEYFIENDTHPNEKGHKKIADMIIEKYDVDYK